MPRIRFLTPILVVTGLIAGAASPTAGASDQNGGNSAASPEQLTEQININPNNSSMRLEVYIPSSEPDHGFDGFLTRDDLLHPHDWDDRDTGTLYAGPAERIIIRPKGGQDERDLNQRLSGNEGWDVVSIRNGKTYRLIASNGATPVRVYNTKMNPNGPMGHWYLGLGSGSGSDDGTDGSNDDDRDVANAEYSRVVYGINRNTGELRRYDLSASNPSESAESIGIVRNGEGNTLKPIDAGAYLPGLTNMFTFYQKPGTKQTRLTYVNLHTAEAGFVGEPIQGARVTGAAMAGDDLYAVQAPPKIDFEIEGDTVVAQEEVSAKVSVLGAAITSGQQDVPVTMRVNADGTTHDAFGDFASPGSGNVNDQRNPRQFILPEQFPAGAPIDVRARSWLHGWHKDGGEWDKGWYSFLDVESEQDSDHLIVLRDGEPVPDIEPLRNQDSIASFVSDYVDEATGTISLQQNQAIYLYELGTQDLESNAADFQDLVVLVTLARDAETLEGGGTAGGGNASSTGAKLVRVNPRTAEVEDTVMPLQRAYDSLAHAGTNTFHATKEDSLYRIDVSSLSESRVRSFDGADMRALAYAGNKLSSFEQAQSQKLWPTDPDVLQAVGGAKDIQMEDLGTMIFVDSVNDPADEPRAYD